MKISCVCVYVSQCQITLLRVVCFWLTHSTSFLWAMIIPTTNWLTIHKFRLLNLANKPTDRPTAHECVSCSFWTFDNHKKILTYELPREFFYIFSCGEWKTTKKLFTIHLLFRCHHYHHDSWIIAILEKSSCRWNPFKKRLQRQRQVYGSIDGSINFH